MARFSKQLMLVVIHLYTLLYALAVRKQHNRKYYCPSLLLRVGFFVQRFLFPFFCDTLSYVILFRLLAVGANPNNTNEDGESPIELAECLNSNVIHLPVSHLASHFGSLNLATPNFNSHGNSL
mmetsp:Transcript_49/g.57  ORF Transcript_49/g.57 Transcript_49/m.57 type:complete len:123 (-) Transcript_49:130-498(-)